ncbi:sensor histidine kinase [Actinomycetospora callitridis]|uniref:sensor histidine kinase n=1 Tax=Actinomycetospora callitridis TaxID=913944 RepID=UPI002366C3BA|nr:sensor histidine kinase [Actinomycetospora callitridis]MDD7919840.1 CHASE3 domain-containing protein [Actinomycetospora callitridis]
MSAPTGIAEDTTDATPDVDDGPPAAAPVPRPRRRRRDGLSRWPLQRILLVTGAALGVLLLVALLVGIAGLTALSGQRAELVDRLDPALLTAQQLDAATVDQETGVRGYVLLPRPELLDPYTRGRADEAELVAGLRALVGGRPEALAQLEAVEQAIAQWRTTYAEPSIAAAGLGVPGPSIEVGKVAFDQVRAALDAQRTRLFELRNDARDGLDGAADTLAVGGAVTLVVVALGVLALLEWLRRVVVAPTHRLAREVRQVADGDLDHQVLAAGPREITELGEDVEAMRVLIVRELADTERARQELDTRSRELARSNSDLEQFAYVASHDLQEPLRKVASFCQLLQRRYAGQLDERADQYIEFASDGAKRMQVLINDLLAFSRVGRQGDAMETVDLNRLVDRAAENVAGALEESGGAVEHGDLPRVHGAPALLTTVFQNLLGNSLKFRGEDPPRVRVDAERDGDRWLLRFRDNGIGIDPEYAERIFVIFQRLHGRNTYPGTGIGLAMCRKILEHHDGSMWLDTDATPGTTFVVALPALTDPDTDPEPAPRPGPDQEAAP